MSYAQTASPCWFVVQSKVPLQQFAAPSHGSPAGMQHLSRVLPRSPHRPVQHWITESVGGHALPVTVQQRP